MKKGQDGTWGMEQAQRPLMNSFNPQDYLWPQDPLLVPNEAWKGAGLGWGLSPGPFV